MADHPSVWDYLTAYDLGMDRESIRRSFSNHVEYTQGKDRFSVTGHDFFKSLAHAARDRMLDRWNKTQQSYYEADTRRVYYLSLEFLMGRLLRNGLINLGIEREAKEALALFQIDMDKVLEEEWDAGLGNGGLGRLAACFLDSMATLRLPAMGCGIRYEYGIFRQNIVNGEQVEQPDNWLRYGCPWEIPRPECLYPIKFHGWVRPRVDEQGRTVFDWVDTQDVMAMAYDVPVPGYRNETVNMLRLWSAKASREFDFANFNRGDYIQAVQDKNATENISRVLYPNDKVLQGRELRLKQEYFFVSATLQDAIKRHLKLHPTVANLHEKVVFQLNDTHPALAVAELMRLLLDVHGLGWDEAFAVTEKTFAYTNHTVLPEALEQWPVHLVTRVLPRHMQIIEEVNRRFLEEVRGRFPGDEPRVQRMSLIAEGYEKQVRMANLAIVGSYSVNGVSALHSRILQERIFKDFAEFYPGKFNNKTNGITPRRWLLSCNPGLAQIISSRIGDGFGRDLGQLEELVHHMNDRGFQEEWRKAKRANKERLAECVKKACGVSIDPASLFDVQVKRFHEYKRQHLNILQVLRHYLDIKGGRVADPVPRTFVFGGKAAPGYDMAKRIIRLIHAVGDLVNGDQATRDLLKVVFVPNYSVSLAEIIIPAADVSEQISTAGMEASGTGNMKFALNGALTVGTLDGANVEIMEAVGGENIFIFGLDAQEVEDLRARGYDPYEQYSSDPDLREVLDMISSGALSHDDPGRFQPIVDSFLRHGDPFFVLADFASYCDCHAKVDAAYRDQEGWTRKSIANVARMGRFSSDYTITQYANDIWRIPVAPAPAENEAQGSPQPRVTKPPVR
jgi:glycogen phosphorylase